MADWKEQLQQIQAMRLQRKQQDEQLHEIQIKLQKTVSQLKKSGRQETTLPADQKRIDELRNKIAELEAELLALNKELSGLNATFEKISEFDNYIEFLQKKITTAQ